MRAFMRAGRRHHGNLGKLSDIGQREMRPVSERDHHVDETAEWIL